MLLPRMGVKELLQGRWLGHPLHPAIVHVPTGLWPAALVFDVLSLLGGGSNVAVRLAFWCAAVGLAGAVVAVGPGLADWWDIKPRKPARKLGVWHMTLNLTAAAIFAIDLLLRLAQGLDARSVSIAVIVLCALGNVIVFVSGYLGGRMVYEHGISVARMSKKKWREIAEEGKAHLPAE